MPLENFVGAGRGLVLLEQYFQNACCHRYLAYIISIELTHSLNQLWIKFVKKKQFYIKLEYKGRHFISKFYAEMRRHGAANSYQVCVSGWWEGLGTY